MLRAAKLFKTEVLSGPYSKKVEDPLEASLRLEPRVSPISQPQVSQEFRVNSGPVDVLESGYIVK